MIHFTKAAAIGVVYGVGWLATANTTVDEHSLISIGFAVAIVGFTGGLAWKINGWKTAIEFEHKESRDELKDVKKLVQLLMRERRLDADSLRAEIMLPIPTPTDSNPAAKNDYIPVVLIIDDDPHDRMLVLRNLSKSGFGVVEANSLEQARSIIGSYKIDCVLLDLNLRGGGKVGTGVQSLVEFVREYPNALCLALTGNEDPEVKSQALAAGADAFALKADTANPGYLPKVIRIALDRHAMRTKE